MACFTKSSSSCGVIAVRLSAEPSEFSAGFGQTWVRELLALDERGSEALSGQLDLAEAGVGDAAQVQPIGLPPGVLAFRMDRTVQCLTGALQRRLRIASIQVDTGQGQAELDGIVPEAAG